MQNFSKETSQQPTNQRQPQKPFDHKTSPGLWQHLTWWEITLIGAFLFAVVWTTAPALKGFACKAQQSEARYLLTRLHAAQLLHQSQHDKPASLQALQKNIPLITPARFYTYQLQKTPASNRWHIVAHGVPDTAVHGDVWRIGAAGQLQNLLPMCYNASRALHKKL
ncbi:MAG: hypothetical protein AAF320_05030 [Myxococcota bacterium]